MFEIIKSPVFQVALLGSILLAISSSLIGSFSLYKGQSLIGDSLSHATYPGVILAFILSLSRNPFILLLGASAFAIIAYICIQIIKNYSKLSFDTALAAVLSGFFGLGMMLKTLIQGNPNFTKASQSGLSHYIFGQTSFMRDSDVLVIFIFTLIIVSILLLFYRQIVIGVFDINFAVSLGISKVFIDSVLLIMMVLVISIGLKAVGVILISSFLIIPCMIANQYSKDIKKILLIAPFVSVLSCIIGTYVSAYGYATGPCIIIVMSIIAFISMFIGKYSAFRISKRF